MQRETQASDIVPIELRTESAYSKEADEFVQA